MADKPALLFLAHRIPYPPNKGDKIRSFHILKRLSEHFSVHLGTFIDDPEDWQYCSAVSAFCAQAHFVERKPRWHKLRALSGLLSGKALSVAYYASGDMQQWVDRQLREFAIEQAVLFCSPMAQFIGAGHPGLPSTKRTVIDFVDLDSEKWSQYAATHGGIMRLLYAREGRALLAHERRAAGVADQSFFVSEPEAALFRERAPEVADRVAAFVNGVDTDFFAPDPDLPKPYAEGAQVLVFTGAMDYWPNIDAVSRFAHDVFPELYGKFPSLQFWIVGGKPTSAVKRLAEHSAIHVTGRVPDVRPYIQHALAAVAPMQIARGIQNKVLESLAMHKPIIASPEALEGIEQGLYRNIAVARSKVEWVEAVRYLCSGIGGPTVATVAFESDASDAMSWSNNLKPMFAALNVDI
ncbi:sugar transferase, PEP-CTERM/EpsH1 system associated [gamma proteobacterium NOR5-3]|nr:sugar transferase, PEP-CTERM/EpsH1 system associated [gamma proteobacterium NOR5-3]